jgi:redox-sensitive bicupin YhaK (pirin superfamily)
MFVSRLEPGVSVEHDFGEGRGGYFYLISGEAYVNRERLQTGDAAYVRGSGLLTVRATDVSELILVDTPL